MKKWFLASLAAFSLSVSSLALADTANTYFSTGHPGPHVPSKGHAFAAVNATYMPTEIWVFNFSCDPVWAQVPNSPISDLVAPNGGSTEIWNYYRYDPTEVRLVDGSGRVFFDQFVGNHAIVDTYLGPNGLYAVVS